MKHEINERVVRALPHTFFDYSKGYPSEEMKEETFQVFCENVYGDNFWTTSSWEGYKYGFWVEEEYAVLFWTYLQNPLKGK